MAVERKLTLVSPIAFTANGGSNGLVTVSSTYGFKVKAQVVISATGIPNQTFEIKRVLSKTQLLVGPGSNIKDRADLSAYVLGLNPTISQPEQDRPGIPFEQHARAVFEEEPTLANRTILVDRLGNPYDENNPIPTGVELIVDNVEVKVDIDAFKTAPDSVLNVGTEDGTVAGAKHVMKVGSDLNLRVKDEEANQTLAEIDSSIDASNLHLADIETAVTDGLSTVNGNLDSIESKLDDVNLNLDEANTSLDSIENKLDTVNTNLDEVNTNIQSLEDTAIDIEANTSETNNQLTMANSTLDAIQNALENPLQIDQPVITAGTKDGTPTGEVFVNVNNIRQQILESHDRVANFTYADFGTKNERIAQIQYTSPTFAGKTVVRTFNYTLVSNQYRRDSEVWSEI
jgi:flagellin-like hook-associated protein FlgL